MSFVDLDTIHTPSAGQRPPAAWGAQVNTNFDAINTNVLAKLAGWTSYTPTVTQSSSVSKTVTYSKYVKLGRTVIWQASLAITGAGSSATAITVSLPATAATSNIIVGNFYLSDASGGIVYFGAAVLASTGTVAGVLSGTNGTALGAAGFTAALASGDSVFVDIKYESAT